ncbi:MAG: DUF3105 domain-containing protein [Actinomycetota bacterium]|nr:DUF3105 domain-containing protein [Actinomycetota bacterium]
MNRLPLPFPRRALVLSLSVVALTSCGNDGTDEAVPSNQTLTSAPTTTAPRTTTGLVAPSTTSTTALAGVQTFPPPSNGHVLGPISYDQVPPVGGDHNPVWQNCGFYSSPVAPERAVHSLEHGAVWITYQPDLPGEEIEGLRQLARSGSHIIVSPWPDGSLPSPIVASAWALQLQVSSASDPALAAFVAAYAGRGLAPEPGASCRGAFGRPE